jgi:hypothetical protein
MRGWWKAGELGDRFYTKADPDPTEWVLVEKEAEGKCFLSLVPPEEAKKYRKVKLP